MSKGIVVIFPHAGAAKPNYAVYENSLGDEYRVIFIDYHHFYKYAGDFESLCLSVSRYLNDILSEEPEPVFFLSHSMGSYIAYDIIKNRRFQKKLVHCIFSDAHPIRFYEPWNIDMSEDETRNDFIMKRFPVPDALKKNHRIFNFYLERIIKDLAVLDTIDASADITEEWDSSSLGISVFSSSFMNFSEMEAQWRVAFLPNENITFRYFDDDHTYVIKKESADGIIAYIKEKFCRDQES